MTDVVMAFLSTAGLFTCVGWITWALAYNFRRGWVAKRQAEVHLQLFSRLGTGPEVVNFLQSPAGQQLLDAVGVERSNLVARIMGSVQAGIVLVFLGLSLLLVRRFVVDGGALLIAGVPSIAIGAGFLVSSALSYWLSRSLGLINDGQVKL